MSSSLEQTIAQIKDYDDPSPRITEVLEAGEARLFLGDARVSLGELVKVPTTGETLRVRELYGQRAALAGTLDSTLRATATTPVEPTGKQARLPAPQGHTWRLSGASYVSEDHGKTLPAQPEAPGFEELDGQRDLLPTGIDALDLLSPLSRGGVNLIIDSSSGRQGYEALRERVERELGEQVTRMTVREEPLVESKNLRQVICANKSNDAFYTALRVAATCVQVHSKLGDEIFFFASLPFISSHEAWQRYNASGGARSGAEMGYGEVISWLGDHLASTKSARVTTLLTLTMQGAEGDLSALVDTMGLGDVDAMIIIDEQGRYAPRRSRSRTALPESRAVEATRVRSMLHRAHKLAPKLRLFGEDELEPEELETIEEASQWSPLTTK